MNPNLKWKALFILLVILGCIYGLVGLPTFPTSVAQLKDNFSHQIKLGLDLQGGTHLVLQVQVQEAIAQETDQMVDRVTTWLRGKNIHYDEVRRVDDTHILVRNVDPDAAFGISRLSSDSNSAMFGTCRPRRRSFRLHADSAARRHRAQFKKRP